MLVLLGGGGADALPELKITQLILERTAVVTDVIWAVCLFGTTISFSEINAEMTTSREILYTPLDD